MRQGLMNNRVDSLIAIVIAAVLRCPTGLAQTPEMVRPELRLPALPVGMRTEQLQDGRWAAIGARNILWINLDPVLDANWLETQRAVMREFLMVPIELESPQSLSRFASDDTRASLDAIRQVVDGLQTEDARNDAAMFMERLRRTVPSDTVALVVLRRTPDNPHTAPILAAPDAMWALIETAWVETGSNSQEQTQARLARQLYRALGFLFGLPYTQEPNAVMKPAPAPAVLDTLSANYFPGNLGLFQNHAFTFGLEPIKRLTPRQLVRLGIATPDIIAQVRARDAQREAAGLPPLPDVFGTDEE